MEVCIPTLGVSARASTCVGSRNHALSFGTSIGLTAPYFHMPHCRRGGSHKRCSDRGVSLPVIPANMNLIDMIYQIAVTIDASAYPSRRELAKCMVRG